MDVGAFLVGCLLHDGLTGTSRGGRVLGGCRSRGAAGQECGEGPEREQSCSIARDRGGGVHEASLPPKNGDGGAVGPWSTAAVRRPHDGLYDLLTLARTTLCRISSSAPRAVHAISEVGAATIVGGNIHGHTQVMTTAIVENVGRGEFGAALVYGGVLLALAFFVNGLLASVQQRSSAWARS